MCTPRGKLGLGLGHYADGINEDAREVIQRDFAEFFSTSMIPVFSNIRRQAALKRVSGGFSLTQYHCCHHV